MRSKASIRSGWTCTTVLPGHESHPDWAPAFAGEGKEGNAGVLALVPHPDFPSVAITSISVEAIRSWDNFLKLSFHIAGAIDEVRWRAIDGPSTRADRLWEHSCFEAFVGSGAAPSYLEFNFTPIQWAAYAFDGYRDGMRDIPNVLHWGALQLGDESALAKTTIGVSAFDDNAEWRLGLSAIIEARDGSKSYWALAHAPGKPDFHNADCFTARLAAPERA